RDKHERASFRKPHNVLLEQQWWHTRPTFANTRSPHRRYLGSSYVATIYFAITIQVLDALKPAIAEPREPPPNLTSVALSIALPSIRRDASKSTSFAVSYALSTSSQRCSPPRIHAFPPQRPTFLKIRQSFKDFAFQTVDKNPYFSKKPFEEGTQHRARQW
ncbi:hypothetical protein FIE12Z_9937, partial [Fusarium flagelliforme]